MAPIHITKDQSAQYDISTSGNRVILDKGVSIDSPSNGINEFPNASTNVIVVKGTITSTSQGIFNAGVVLQGTGSELEVTGSGKLAGDIGALIYGDNETLVNHGRIEGDSFGLAVAGANVHLVNRGEIIADDGTAIFTNVTTGLRLDNHGLIRSDDGFDFQSQTLELNLGRDSLIELISTGSIRTNSVAGWTATIRNDGEITHENLGMSSAISGGAGTEIVRNTGRITGFVDLGAGDDRYDGRGGRIIDGTVLGGDGNDVYLISNSKDRVHDSVGFGHDRLTVSCSYSLGANNEIEETRLVGRGNFNLTGNGLHNYLEGNKGDNRLVGMGGDDAFSGGAGKDVMTGGSGIDAFYIKSNSDREIVTDFTNGEDVLVLFTGKEITSVDDLLLNHAHQVGSDVVISGDGTQMILRDFDLANLTDADFAI